MKLFFAMLLSIVPLLGADAEPTAFELAKEGNRYVGEQSKDRIVQIRSERSVGSLVPKIWHITYFDPTATFKSAEVKFAAGKMVDVKRPFRLIERAGGGSKELDREKLKVDSDQAIKKASNEPIFKDIKLKSVEAKLEDSASGPVWRIKLWAEKLNGRDTVEIGRLTITADDETVIETDVHLNRLN